MDSTNQPEHGLFLKDLTENDATLEIDYNRHTEIAARWLTNINHGSVISLYNLIAWLPIPMYFFNLPWHFPNR